MFTNLRLARDTALLAVFAFSSSVFAAGFEKSISWSGRWAGVGGAATAGVTGAEALYFNPAGLAGAQQNEFVANFSPTFSRFEAPVGTGGAQVLSTTQMSPMFGALGSYKVNEKMGIGLG